MSTYRKFLLGAILAASAIIPVATADAQRIYVSVEDRPYYRHGPSYWHDDVHYVWVPGHRAPSGRWIRGRYVVRERRNPIDALQRRHRARRALILGR